jgi:hypothetical protein
VQVPDDVLEASLGGLAFFGCGGVRRARILLANQNLLYLVFKCLMNTKHSREVADWQAVFDAQE